MSVRRHGALTCAAAVTLSFCSAAPTSSDADAGPPPPDAFIAATLSSGPGATGCGQSASSPWLDLGTAAASPPTTMPDGSMVGDATVSIQCSVHRQTSPVGYDMQVTIGIQDASGVMNAYVGIDAFEANPITTAGGTALTAWFTKGPNFYQASGCTFEFSYRGQSIPIASAIGPGHVWGHLSCTTSTPTGEIQSPCQVEVEFLVENCAQ